MMSKHQTINNKVNSQNFHEQEVLQKKSTLMELGNIFQYFTNCSTTSNLSSKEINRKLLFF